MGMGHPMITTTDEEDTAAEVLAATTDHLEAVLLLRTIIPISTRTVLEAVHHRVEGHLRFVEIEVETVVAEEKERQAYPCLSEMLHRKSPPKIYKWRLEELEMFVMSTFQETTILSNPRDLPLLNTQMPTWLEKLAMKWIDSGSRAVSWKSSLHKNAARLLVK